MWSADVWHSDQSEDSLKGGENWGVVGREMRKPEWKRESIGPPGFQGREGKVNNRAVEGRDGGMWRERAGVWKLIIAGSAGWFYSPSSSLSLALSLSPPHIPCDAALTRLCLREKQTLTHPHTHTLTGSREGCCCSFLPLFLTQIHTLPLHLIAQHPPCLAAKRRSRGGHGRNVSESCIWKRLPKRTPPSSVLVINSRSAAGERGMLNSHLIPCVACRSGHYLLILCVKALVVSELRSSPSRV